MINNTNFKVAELLLLFFVLPLLLTVSFLPILKVLLGLAGIGYCLWITLKLRLISLRSLYQINWGRYWITILISFVIIGISSFIIMYFSDPDNLFIVVRKRPLLWVGILVFYALFSAYPQELLYRSFFFKRYGSLFKNVNYLIFTNIIVFPLAHLMFENWLVLLFTLIAGTLFTLTYYRSQSVLLTSIEHALYGNWIFTIGMGEMLAFPMPS